MKGILLSGLVIVAGGLLVLSCSWSYNRKYVPPAEYAAEEVAGWQFVPQVESYHFTARRGAPADSGGLWLNLAAYHSKANEEDTLYGVNIDTVYMSYGDPIGQRHTWVLHACAYGDALEYRRLVKQFRFRNPSGDYFFIVPDEVDTLYLEFTARFYRGILKHVQPNPAYSSINDTIVGDTIRREAMTRSVRLKLHRTESKRLVPSFL